MKRYAIVIGAALLLSLSACAPAVDGEQAAPAPAASAPAAAAEPVVEPTEPPESKVVISSWGQTFAYGDGLTVTIAQPVAFTPSESAAGVEGFTTFSKVDIVVLNGTAEAFEPAMFQIGGTSGGTPMSQVFDSEGNLMGAPSAALLPGQSVTFSVGFGVAAPADLTLDAQPGFDYASAYWQGASA